MCIFNTDTKVSKTKIFVASLNGGQRQLTLYSNQAQAVNANDPNNAMILPIPSRSGGSDIKLHDFSKVADLFATLDRCFPRTQAQDLSFGMRNQSYSNSSLTVHQVGDYQCSIVPSVHDFGLLRADTFQVSPHIASLLQQHYASDFSFLVCRFKDGGSFHPLGYSHDVSGGRIFIPTRHEHGGTSRPHGTSSAIGGLGSGLPSTFTRLLNNPTGYPSTDAFGTPFGNYETSSSVQSAPFSFPPSALATPHPEWDHEIYLCNVASTERQPTDMSLSVVQNYSALTTTPLETTLASWPVSVPKPIHNHLLQKVTIKGAWENKDLWEWDINKIVNHPVCTFDLTGKRYIIQPWYECKTCKLTDSLGCCAQCARSCHKAKGHQVVYRFISPSCFCDCNSETEKSPDRPSCWNYPGVERDAARAAEARDNPSF